MIQDFLTQANMEICNINSCPEGKQPDPPTVQLGTDLKIAETGYFASPSGRSQRVGCVLSPTNVTLTSHIPIWDQVPQDTI